MKSKIKSKVLDQLLEANKQKKEQFKHSLINILETQIGIVKGKSKKGDYKPKPAFKPSSMGSPCMRKIYYDYNRVEPDQEFPLRAKKILIVGDHIHEMLSDLLRKAGVLVDYRNKTNGQIPISRHTGEPDPEFPLKDPEHEISAKIDAVTIVDGKLWLNEFKSSNKNKFEKLNGPEEAHKLQASIYYVLFNKLLKEGKYSHIEELKPFDKAEGVRLLYLNKDNSALKEFILSEEQIQESWNTVLSKIKVVKDAIAGDQLPETTWDWCDGCAWRFKCKQDFKISDAID